MSETTLDSRYDDGQPESLGGDIAGMFGFLVDPNSAARRLFAKWFWVFPLLLFIAVTAIANVLVTPMVRHVLETQPAPPNVNPEQYANNIAFGMKIQRVLAFLFPPIIIALEALVLWGMSSVVAVEAKYRHMLNLAAGASIISTLAVIAGTVILKAKGEISTMAELRPALGLDIFLPEGSNKYVAAILGYFSIFEIWWIVMIVLVLAAAYRMSKGKALTIVAPLVFLSLLFRLVGAAFQRT